MAEIFSKTNEVSLTELTTYFAKDKIQAFQWKSEFEKFRSANTTLPNTWGISDEINGGINVIFFMLGNKMHQHF